MATLHFNHIILKLAGQGSISWDTLQSQDGLILGHIRFCPIQLILCMQYISLDFLQRLITEGTFIPPTSEGTLELSRTTAILLIFQADNQHEKITDIYVGLMVHCIESCLYAPDKILDFVSNIEVNLKVTHDVLKAWGDPGKRHAFCLFVNSYGGTMSIPTDLSYCLVCPMSYMKDMEPDHFNTCNNPAGTHLHHCICCTTLQHMRDDPHHCREYGGSDRETVDNKYSKLEDVIITQKSEVSNEIHKLEETITSQREELKKLSITPNPRKQLESAADGKRKCRAEVRKSKFERAVRQT